MDDTIGWVVRRLDRVRCRNFAEVFRSQVRPVPLSLTAQYRLLDLVYERSALFWTNAVVILFTGGMVWLRLGGVVPLTWLGVGLLVAGLRIVDHYTYRGRREGGASASALRLRFTALAWAIGLLWGSASGIVLLVPDPQVVMLVTIVQVGFVATTIARNSPLPAAAIAQACLVLLPVALGHLLNPDLSEQLLGLLTIAYTASAVSTTRHFHEQTFRLFQADERNQALVRTLNQANIDLLQANNSLQLIASTDGLTGVANRRRFDAVLAAEWSRAERDCGNLGLLLIDIDWFKAYNDTEGHLRGDGCLRRVATCLTIVSRRPSDLLARYGGEEFVVLLPGADGHGAIHAADTIRHAVEQLALPHPTTRSGIVTISIGAASMRATSATGSAALVAKADEHLYLAKRAGRNCVRGAVPAGAKREFTGATPG